MNPAAVLVWKYGVRVEKEDGEYVLTTPYVYGTLGLDFGDALRELRLDAMTVVYCQEQRCLPTPS